MSPLPVPLGHEALQALILDTEPYLSCDDCFDLVDHHVEAVLSDPRHDHVAMRRHLAGCAACAEEARSLLRLVAEDRGVDPAPALTRLGVGPG